MPSENGWNPARANGATDCQWVRIPGAEHVSLQFLKGQPLQILRAYAADYHAYIEPLRDADSASYTPTNSVATSNHLNGTAMDLNWNSHPFRVDYAGFDGPKIQRMRELLAFYNFEGLQIMFWAQDWKTPKDAMHHQLGYKTYGDPRVQRFIDRRIRADGFSTYKRGGTTAPPVPPVSGAADVLARATGLTPARAAEILPTMVDGLKQAQCTNANRIAMFIAQTGHESAGFQRTEEYASGAAYEGRVDLGNTQPGDGVRFKGRTWIQITGRHNVSKFSQWAHGKGLVPTPTYFVDRPVELQELRWAGIGAAWYWVVARPDINALSDKRDLNTVTRRINGGTNGLADRQNRYNRALALGDQLLALTSTAPSTPGDDMAQVPQDQWDRVYRELTQRLPSRSPLRHLGEGVVDTLAGFVLNVDGSQHVEIVTRLAKYGDPDALALLHEVAGADPSKYPDRRHDSELAQAILADVTSEPAPQSLNVVNQQTDTGAVVAAVTAAVHDATQQVSYAPAVQPSGSVGQLIGQAYDALEALRLADALPIESRAPLAALISVLETKNGSSL